MVNTIGFIFFMFFFLFLLSVIIGISVITIQIVMRVWSNKITPWIDEQFGKIDW